MMPSVPVPADQQAALALSALEKRGLASLLDDAIDLLGEFDQRVHNHCRCCSAYGGGTSAPHDPICRGVALLRDLREARARLLPEAP
jgi:hypothetical protein